MSRTEARPRARSRSEACERLAQSRERLRQALGPAGPTKETGARSSGVDWSSLFKSVPGAPALIRSLQGWWAHSALNGPAHVAAAAAASMLKTAAQRYPFGLMLAAMALGAALTLSRPWRWAPRAALQSGLWAGLPGLLTAVVARWPVQTWLEVLAEALRQRTPAPAPAAAEGAEPAQAARSASPTAAPPSTPREAPPVATEAARNG
jgi:hypothetical protein